MLLCATVVVAPLAVYSVLLPVLHAQPSHGSSKPAKLCPSKGDKDPWH